MTFEIELLDVHQDTPKTCETGGFYWGSTGSSGCGC